MGYCLCCYAPPDQVTAKPVLRPGGLGFVNTSRHLGTNPNLDERFGDLASTQNRP
jgi:hypothetical protein